MKKLLIALTGILLAGSSMLAQPLPKITAVFHLASPGGWDFLTVGPGNNRLYISHATQVNILDLQTGDSVGVIPNTTGVHGIAFDAAQKKGYVSNGKLNNVTVFDVNTNEILGQIPTGEKPDVIMYEPFSKKIVTFNGVSNNISIIDPVKDQVVATIAINGKPEGAVSDGAGKVYVNIEDKNEILVISMTGFKILKHWPITPGSAASGLAIDATTKRLFAGCENKMLVVMDATNGKLISHFPIGEECDGVAFDNGSKMIYVSNGDGTLTVIKEQSRNSFKLLGNVKTKKGAKTLCIDETTHKIYLPTADLEKTIAPGAKRPAMIPGTFQVLVLN